MRAAEHVTLPRPKRRWRNYLIDKKLQLRYILFVASLSAALSGGFGFMIWQQERLNSETVVEQSQGLDDAGLESWVAGNVQDRDTSLGLAMVLAGIGIALVLSLFMVLMTHRVAGPLYKVGRYFEQMRTGRLGEVYGLRKGDLLQDFYEQFRAAHQTTRARHVAENELVGRFLSACSQAGLYDDPVLASSLARMERHHQRREMALVD